MRRRMLGLVVAGGLLAGLFGMNSASAACEHEGTDGNPRRDGNEVAGVYVEDPPVDATVAGRHLDLEKFWVEVQDDGSETPIAAEWGIDGDIIVFSRFGLWGCSDWTIEAIKDELGL